MRRALIVLGGGLCADGTMPYWVDARADHAAKLWKTGDFEWVITSGRGPMSDGIRTEAKTLAEALIKRGVSADHIIEEDASTSTLANAYYCRTAHTNSLGIDHVVVVTNSFHARRTERIFTHVYGIARSEVEPTDDSVIDPEVLEILRNTDDPQDEFLTTELFPRIKVGDLAGIHQYLFNKNSELAQLWRTYRARHQQYRDARNQLNAIMANPQTARQSVSNNRASSDTFVE